MAVTASMLGYHTYVDAVDRPNFRVIANDPNSAQFINHIVSVADWLNSIDPHHNKLTIHLFWKHLPERMPEDDDIEPVAGYYPVNYPYMYPHEYRDGSDQIHMDMYQAQKHGWFYDLKTSRTFHMPSKLMYCSKHPWAYYLTHEWGHMRSRRFIDGRDYPETYWEKAAKRHMSFYGQRNTLEAEAEAYAEWHVSGGRTENLAAKVYARNLNWYKFRSNDIGLLHVS